MILIDNNQIMIANIFMLKKSNVDITTTTFLQAVLNNYRLYRNMFKREYGEIVICNDSINCWRREDFPNYKANRRRQQKDSDINWDSIHEHMNEIRDEVREHLPYKSIKVDRLEADDIIFSLVKRYHTQEKMMIVSGDKDFIQLQMYPNVYQYSPIQRVPIECSDPKKYLFELTMRGDSADGIPNVLSDDDTFIDDEKRQTRLTSKKLEIIFETKRQGKKLDDSIEKNIKRNENLIDLSKLPQKYFDEVIEQYEDQQTPQRSKLLEYFIDHRLTNLTEVIGDF